MYLSLLRTPAALTETLAAVTWTPHAEVGSTHPAGQLTADMRGQGLVFILSYQACSGPNVLMSHPCDLPVGAAMLRVDEVCFPVGAIAARHTHAGAGIRHLVRGALQIEADDHTQTMQVGDCWFEAAHSPVRAVALQDLGVTSFLRGMVIPAEYAGRSTFQLADPAEAALPRLQVTHRHIDLPLQFDAG